jgi:hypothetical protein
VADDGGVPKTVLVSIILPGHFLYQTVLANSQKPKSQNNPVIVSFQDLGLIAIETLIFSLFFFP